MRRIILGATAASLVGGAFAAPLTPTITSHDINFGAFNSDIAEWAQNGLLPDTLTYTPGSVDTEATAYWPTWPTPPVLPIFNAAGAFGGDFLMDVHFTGQDAPYVGPGGVIDVSLTGTGANAAGPDLVIFGAIPGAGIPFGPLWMLDLDLVSLYGYSGSPTSTHAYVLEGVGTIVGGEIAQRNNLIGQTGVMRGHLDFVDVPVSWIPALYNPVTDQGNNQFRAAFSGETGVGYAVPEPASLIALTLGGIGLLARRRRK